MPVKDTYYCESVDIVIIDMIADRIQLRDDNTPLIAISYSGIKIRGIG